MNIDSILAVTFSLVLEERADVSHVDYINSDYYDPKKPVSDSTKRLKDLAEKVRLRIKIPFARDTNDLFCKIAQAYRLKAWEYKEMFFEH